MRVFATPYISIGFVARLAQGLRLYSSSGANLDYFGTQIAKHDVYLISASMRNDVGANNNQGSATVYQLSLTTGAWTEEDLIVASDGSANDKFGNSAAIYQTTAVVGASFDDSAVFLNQGSVFVYDRDSLTSQWLQSQKISVDTEIDAYFGYSVAIYDVYMAIGMPGSGTDQGRVYIYQKGGSWTQTGTLSASVTSDEELGNALSMYGTSLVAAAFHYDGTVTDQGAVFVCSAVTRACTSALLASSPVTGDEFGTSVSYDGTKFIVGAPGRNSDTGQAFVFAFSGGVWSIQGTLTPNGGNLGDFFGFSVALSGTYACIGSPYEDYGLTFNQGAIQVFEYSASVWSFVSKIGNLDPYLASSECGYSVFLSGTDLYSSCTGSYGGLGAVYTYKKITTPWEYVCLAGNEVDSADADCVPCAAGEYKNVLGQSCSSCAVGKYNPNTGSSLSTDCLNCAAGTYNEVIGQAACTGCAVGKSNSNAGSSSSSDCISCLPGKYNSMTGQATCTNCVPGKYNPSTGSISSSDCLSCAIGKSNPTSGSSSSSNCVECATGKYNAAVGQGTCTDCGVGKYNPNTGSSLSTDCLNCAAGTYNDVIGQPACTGCAVGKSNSNTGSSSASACVDCSSGKYNSVTGQGTCIDCLPGSYNPNTASSSSSDCLDCAAGKSNPTSGSSSSSACVDCAAGKYNSAVGQGTCTNCIVGSYNPSTGSTVSTDCLECSMGTSNPTSGSSSSSDCISCSSGKYNSMSGQGSCTNCVPGSYNPNVGSVVSSDCLECDIGTSNPTSGSSSSSDCVDCAAGKYNSVTGQGTCTDCGIGTYNPNTASTVSNDCLNCAAGKSNPTSGSSSSSACVDCFSGKFNAMTGQGTCTDCGVGSYNPNIGSASSSDCLDCTTGKYGESAGSSACTDCVAGKYSNDTAQSACDDCIPGRFGSSDGADSFSDCLLCNPGTYSEFAGMTGCEQCPVDYKQPNYGGSVCTNCAAGYCTLGVSGSTTCFACENYLSIWDVHGCTDDAINNVTVDCPTTGNIPIDVLGPAWNFTDVSAIQVSVSGKLCPVITTDFVSFITCMLPSGVGLEVDLQVSDTVKNRIGLSHKLSYITPLLTTIHGCDDSEALPDVDGTSACSRDGTDEVTVTGNNFGPNQASIFIGGVKATNVPLSSRDLSGWEQNTTIVQVPAGSGLGVGVNVLQKGGELSDGVRMLSYKSCDPGFYNLRNVVTGIYECVECDVGYYNLGYESFSCEICQAGSYCSSSSISSCDSILLGSSSPSSSTDPSSCICSSNLVTDSNACLCPPGQEYVAAGDYCTACPFGTFKEGFNLEACVGCSLERTTTLSTGSMSSTDCVCANNLVFYGGACVCAPGYGYDANLLDCIVCNSDEFQLSYSLGICSLCTDSLMDGNNQCACPTSMTLFDDRCVCDSGFEIDSEDFTCRSCDIGEFKYGLNFGSCVACSDDHSTTVLAGSMNSSDCVCQSGYIDASADESSLSCVSCSDGMTCDSPGLTSASVSIKAGYWKEGLWSNALRKCHLPEACSDSTAQCADEYSGPLCAVCEAGYDSPNSYNTCEKCFQGSTSASFYTFILILIVWFSWRTFRYSCKRGYFMQFIILVTDFVSTPSFQVMVRILLVYAQIIAQFLFILPADIPTNYSNFLSMLQFVNFNLSSIFSLRCSQYDFFDELMIATLLPIFVCLFILAAYLKRAVQSDDHFEKANSKAQCIGWFLFTLYFFFSSASRAVFETFNCDDDFESGASYLRADYRLECSGSTYESYRGWAILMIIVYPIGIPVLFWGLLFPHRDTINDTTLCTDSNIDSLCGCSSGNRLLDALTDLRQLRDVKMQKRENRTACSILRSDIEERVKIEFSRTLPKLQGYALLYEAYRTNMWYWEFVECLRRLLLTGLLVFMYPGSEKQILAAMIICMMFMMLYSWTNPVVDNEYNYVLLASMWAILFQLYGILLMSLDLGKEESDAIGGLMVILAIFFPVSFLIARNWSSVMKSRPQQIAQGDVETERDRAQSGVEIAYEPTSPALPDSPKPVQRLRTIAGIAADGFSDRMRVLVKEEGDGKMKRSKSFMKKRITTNPLFDPDSGNGDEEPGERTQRDANRFRL